MCSWLNVAYFFPLFNLDFYYLPIRSAPERRLFGQTRCGQNEIKRRRGLSQGSSSAAVGGNLASPDNSEHDSVDDKY